MAPTPQWQPGPSHDAPAQRSGAPVDSALGPPPNATPHVIMSIATTLCCCLPFGIVAMIYAFKAQGHVTAGNFAAATKAIGTSKVWWVLGMLGGAIVIVLYGVLVIGSEEGWF